MTHLWTKKTRRTTKEGSQRNVLSKSLIPSEQDRCHPSQSTRPHRSKPLSRTLQHGPAPMEIANPLTILIYRPSVLRVVGFVVRCTGVMTGFLIWEFLTDFGFSRRSRHSAPNIAKAARTIYRRYGVTQRPQRVPMTARQYNVINRTERVTTARRTDSQNTKCTDR